MPRPYTMRNRKATTTTGVAKATTVWLDGADIAYIDSLAGPRRVSRGRIITELIDAHRKRAERRANGRKRG
jgi:hypothetical protein